MNKRRDYLIAAISAQPTFIVYVCLFVKADYVPVTNVYSTSHHFLPFVSSRGIRCDACCANTSHAKYTEKSSYVTDFVLSNSNIYGK